MLSNQKIITFTRSERWRSILHQHVAKSIRVTALDFDDLTAEATRWPGSAAVIEIDATNLLEACHFAMHHAVQNAGCGLFATTDAANAGWLPVLAVAGFVSGISNPTAAQRLVRQIEAYHAYHRPQPLSIETEFQRRLPWQPLDRYPNRPFVATQFSSPEP